ncbi:Hypothetical predicted protein [Olea europaea subsp. europaea]|uniref:Uncharacterized protein n=1 Tax=Olea europaea subsp. europaea TaxID=158383 RepID=A0A8S0SYR4_OLEEU|nr:Hypothetical predicted protein [Olea europaea subsp. europaea]
MQSKKKATIVESASSIQNSNFFSGYLPKARLFRLSEGTSLESQSNASGEVSEEIQLYRPHSLLTLKAAAGAGAGAGAGTGPILSAAQLKLELQSKQNCTSP